MPELPEVESTRRTLAPGLVGRLISAVAIHPGAERLAVTHRPREFEEVLTGRRIHSLGRHGKYLLAELDGGLTWVVHLRMSGSLMLAAQGEPADRYERARVSLDGGSELRFNDMRKFGTWQLVDDPSVVIARVGPDALSPEFTPGWLRAQLARRTVAVKSALLDQRVAAGVGNIYADEACFFAGIDPRTPAWRIGPRRVARLHEGVGRALARALADGGTTFSDYRDGRGQAGAHIANVEVFRREGRPCHRCGTAIRKIRVGGRGTHLCPRCQRR